MRWIVLALFLLSSLSLPGCNKVANGAAAGEETPVLEESLPGEDFAEAPAPSLEESSIVTPVEIPAETPVESADGPPLQAVKLVEDLQGLKSAPKRRIFLLYYSYARESGAPYDCPACRVAKPKLKAWANQQNLTTAEESEGHARSASVRFVDIYRDKVTNDLTLEGETVAMYPTYLWVDQTGKVLWSDCGVKDGPQLTRIWKLLERLK